MAGQGAVGINIAVESHQVISQQPDLAFVVMNNGIIIKSTRVNIRKGNLIEDIRSGHLHELVY